MDIYNIIARRIIEEQESIIGPVALEQARKVEGLKLNWVNHDVNIEGNGTDVIEKLIEQYQYLFGQASVEACKKAVSSVISQVPPDKIPNLLR